MNNRILILGSNSFAAKGLSNLLTNAGFDVHLFFRGEDNKHGSNIYGNVFKLSKNKYLNEKYSCVINFIIIKNSSISENVEYIKELYKYCNFNCIPHLIHISSISVYPNHSILIDESSEIESDLESKGLYARTKVEVDKYLMSVSNQNLHISLVRPGFIIDKESSPSLAGIFLRFPFKIGLLLGNKKTTLPLIEKELLHKSILNILKSKSLNSVYLILNKKLNTKYNFVKNRFNFRIIVLPKRLTLILAKALYYLMIFNLSQYKKVKGLFKITVFDPIKTEKILKIKF